MATELTQIMNGGNVVNAVCIMISEYFNKTEPVTYALYKEAVPQQLKTPCFFVKLISSYVEKGLGNHRIKHHNIMIQYFPADTTKKPEEECHIVEDCLYECLDDVWITVLSGIDYVEQTYSTTQIATHTDFIDSRIVDKVLNFNIAIHSNYRIMPTFPTFMETLNSFVNVDPEKNLDSNTVVFDIEEN